VKTATTYILTLTAPAADVPPECRLRRLLKALLRRHGLRCLDVRESGRTLSVAAVGGNGHPGSGHIGKVQATFTTRHVSRVRHLPKATTAHPAISEG
jgi:hypothetical protein